MWHVIRLEWEGSTGARAGGLLEKNLADGWEPFAVAGETRSLNMVGKVVTKTFIYLRKKTK